MRPAEIVFWGSLAVALYACGIYPLFVWLVSRWPRNPSAADVDRDSESWPSVTLVISASRDEHFIVRRLQNAAALDYPRGLLQIIVGCAGEGDLTGLLARSFDPRQVEVVQFPGRDNAYVLNGCVRQARGEIVVFSDSRTLMRPDAIRRVARHFRNPTVGGVGGKVVVLDLASGRFLDRRPWKVEDFLKRCEARLGALPELNRGLYAIRRDLFVPFEEGAAGDSSSIALEAQRRGYRLIYDERAAATTETTPAAEKPPRLTLLRSEVRHGVSLIWPVVDFPRGSISFFFWLNKVLRRLCPAFLIAAFVSNAFLADERFYLHCLLFHESFYLVAMTALYVTTDGRLGRLWRALTLQGSKNPSFQAQNGWLASPREEAVTPDVSTGAVP
jgi:cellulose synthase/poly-beta-1,6-N-acetylglucosamine synthase-like glycosyltransferase